MENAGFRFSSSRSKAAFAVSLICVLWLSPQAAFTQDPQRLYQIGNSLTWDTQPLRTEAIASGAGEALDIGYHIRCNSSLDHIWNDPTGTCITPNEGLYRDAFANETWDAVSLQPFYHRDSTLGQVLDRVDDFVGLADASGINADAQWYLYAAFPWRTAYRDGFWDGSFVDDPSSSTVYKREFFDVLMSHLDTNHPDRFLRIPGGEVLNSIYLAIEAGEVPGYNSVTELYRDSVHLNETGRFIMSTTVFATVTRTNPIGTAVPRGANGWTTSQVSDELAEVFQEIVWDVVSTDPHAGIASGVAGDFDQNGVVDGQDFDRWRDTFSSTYLRQADANNDGVVNIADYAVWRNALNPAQALSVPEPTTAALVGFAAVGLLARRRVA